MIPKKRLELRARFRTAVGAPARPRVLVVTQHYWPETAAAAQLLDDLCIDLAKLGFEIEVLCGQPSYRSRERIVPTEVRHGVKITRLAGFNPAKRTIPRRLLHYGVFFAQSLRVALQKRRPDALLVISTPPLLLGLTGAVIRQTRGVPFVYSVQDIYPDLAFELGVVPRSPILERILGHVSSMLYNRADALVTLSEGMAQVLRARSRPDAPIEIITNWADTDAVHPLPRSESMAAELQLPQDAFIFQYSGNVGLSQDLETLVEAADLLQDCSIHVAIIGDGNARGSLQRAVRKRGLQNVSFHSAQERDKLPQLLAASDVGLVPMKAEVGHTLVPSKVYGIMAAGRPILASTTPDSEVARIVTAARCGRVVDPGAPIALASTMREFAKLGSGELEAMGCRARAAAEERHSRRSCTWQYAAVLKAVMEAVPC